MTIGFGDEFDCKDSSGCIVYKIVSVYCYIRAVLLFSNSPIFHIVGFGILVFGAMRIVRFDLAHPYVWYSFVFMMYSIGYPVLYIYGMTYDVYVYTKSLMFSQWLALVVFLLVLSPVKTDYSKLYGKKGKIISSKPIMILASIALVLTLFEISTGNYSHKSEIYAEGSATVSIGFRMVLVFLVLFAVNSTLYGLAKSKLDIKMTLYAVGMISLLVFFSGERDLIIRLLVILLFIYYVIVSKSKLTKEVVILGIISLAFLPFLTKYKYYGLTGQKSPANNNIILDFLTSDFVSASKNMQILLLDQSSKGRFRGITWLFSILRALNIDKLLNISLLSPLGWYNDTYFAVGRAGQGFTLVGDGYVNFGYIGVVILFAFVGLIAKILYSRSNKGVYSFALYITSIPVFMYSIRADLANLLSPLINHNLLVVFGLQVLLKILPDSQNTRYHTSITELGHYR